MSDKTIRTILEDTLIGFNSRAKNSDDLIKEAESEIKELLEGEAKGYQDPLHSIHAPLVPAIPLESLDKLIGKRGEDE